MEKEVMSLSRTSGEHDLCNSALQTEGDAQK
jgi:hypothetical protein